MGQATETNPFESRREGEAGTNRAETGSGGGIGERISDTVNRVGEEVSRVGEEVGEAASRHAEKAMESARAARQSTMEAFDEFRAEMRDRVGDGLDNLSRSVADHPLKSIAIAAGIGLLLGMVSRSERR